ILDTVMIGNAKGPAEITAVALANQIFFVYVVVFWGIASGCGVFIGQYYGQGDTKNIKKTTGLGISIALVICLLFFIPSFFAPHLLIGIISNDENVIQLGSSFLQILSLCFFPSAITFTRNACMRNVGQTKVPMVTTSVALVTNFILNFFMLFVFDMPLHMIAVGTVIARTVEMILQSFFLKKLDIPIRGTIKEYLSYDFAFVKEFLKISSFLFLGMTTWSIGTTIYNIAFAYAGTYAQASIKMASSIMQFFAVFGFSLGVASGIIMTNTLGAGKIELAIRYSRKSLYSSFVISGVMALIMIAARSPLMSFFGPEGITAHYLSRLIFIYAGGVILRSVNFANIAGTIRSGGDTKFVFWMDLISVWFIGIPIAFITAMVFGLPIYWIVLFVHMDEVFKIIASTIRVFSNKWAKKFV
ncbi:MAG: MATE family efflux transporter, partial [Defluviitaleaceae bacterium]|nr:MATE family efflux transporter [Defluviitaleaceae bacterium]